MPPGALPGHNKHIEKKGLLEANWPREGHRRSASLSMHPWRLTSMVSPCSLTHAQGCMVGHMSPFRDRTIHDSQRRDRILRVFPARRSGNFLHKSRSKPGEKGKNPLPRSNGLLPKNHLLNPSNRLIRVHPQKCRNTWLRQVEL